MKAPRVLYIVNKLADTSIPLEVADHFGNKVNVKVLAYYQIENEQETLRKPKEASIGVKKRYDIIRGVYGLYKIVKSFRPRVIHVHHTISSLWGSIVGRLMGGAVIVRTEHSDHACYSWCQNAANAVSLALADRVICNSDHTRASYHSWEKPFAAHKSITVHNGVDLRRINEGRENTDCLRAELKIPERIFLLGSVGRLVWQKNYERLVQAMALVCASRVNVQLVIAGGGALHHELRRELKRRGLEERVVLLGNVKRQQVYRLLHALDAFIMPSRAEGFCNAVVEAMAAGCPIIASDIGTLREVVGPVGLYADPESPEDMAATIERMAVMGAQARKRLGQAARKRAEKKFTIQRTAQRYIDVYFDLLKEKMDPACYHG